MNAENVAKLIDIIADAAATLRVETATPEPPPVDPPVDPPPVDPPPTIPPEPTTPPPPMVDNTGKLIRAKHPPPAARELKATPTTLMNVVRNQAQPGDHILLEDGDYGAGYLFDKAFPLDKKLVIRSKTPLGANFSVAARFVAQGYWLYEVRTSYERGPGGQDSFNIKVEAPHINITRCHIQGRDGIASRDGAISYMQVGWNRFTGRNRTASRCDHIYVWQPLAGNWKKPTDGPNNISIHRNYFDDPASTNAEDHSLYFGDTKAARDDIPMMENVFVDYNFWAATCQRTRLLYLKRGALVRRNTCLARGRNFGIRHGKESKFWANYTMATDVHFSGALEVGATPENHHDIRGNECPNASIILFCGSETSAPYQAASYALVASNKCKSIEVGVQRGRNVVAAQGGLTKGVRVLLDGKVKRDDVHLLSCDKPSIKVEDGIGDLIIPAIDRLDETKVGLETVGQGKER